MKQIIIIAVITVAAAVLPLLIGDSPYFIGVMISVLMMAALSSAWNILGGYAGQFSFGHAAYFGAGAYTTMILISRFNFNPLVSMVAGIIVACIIALITGSIVFRLRGHYFGLASIAVAEIVRLSALNFDFTGGAQGILLTDVSLWGLDLNSKLPFFYGMLMVLVVTLGITLYLRTLTTSPTWVAQRVEPGAELDAIFVRLPEALPFAAGRARVAQLLGDPALTHAAVTWITPETILRGVRRMQRALDLGIGSITLLSLALGGITLMSLLVGNVRERVTEIGLRRALGATRRDVAALFVLEGCLLTSLAALVGAGVAQWVLHALAGVPEIPLALDGRLWLAPLGVALAVGLLASYVPARLAAGISPADALRAE